MNIVKSFSYLALLICFIAIYLNLMSGNPNALLDLPSFLFLLTGLSLSLTSFKVSEIYHALQDALNPVSADAIERYSLDKKLLQAMGNYPIWAGAVGFIIGAIHSLGNLDSVKSLTTAFAVSLMGLLYALAFKFFFIFPLEIALDRKQLEINALGQEGL